MGLVVLSRPSLLEPNFVPRRFNLLLFLFIWDQNDLKAENVSPFLQIFHFLGKMCEIESFADGGSCQKPGLAPKIDNSKIRSPQKDRETIIKHWKVPYQLP